MKTLPFVELDSVRPSLAARKVLFRLKKDHAFDLPAARKALSDAGYNEVEVVTERAG